VGPEFRNSRRKEVYIMVRPKGIALTLIKVNGGDLKLEYTMSWHEVETPLSGRLSSSSSIWQPCKLGTSTVAAFLDLIDLHIRRMNISCAEILSSFGLFLSAFLKTKQESLQLPWFIPRVAKPPEEHVRD
jgi:hypothetical protein